MKTRKLGTDTVSAVGLGGMYLSIQGRPDEAQAIATIHAALDAGVTLIDTADVYCLDETDIGHNERVIAKALRGRRERAIVATKGGLRRPGGAWARDARPGHLRRACGASLAALGVDAIDVYQLHAPDDKVPFADSVGALARLREEGKIRQVGLSNVTVAQIDQAVAIVPIASVQNRWNPSWRGPEQDGVLAACERHGIAFIAYSPFGGARGARDLGQTGTLAVQAHERGMSPHRLVLAWMLARSPVAIPIAGARRPESIRDSAAAADVALAPADVAAVQTSFGGKP
jgi:aryl-alcohol dehydrogenase-like predicted oxidoreductase